MFSRLELMEIVAQARQFSREAKDEGVKRGLRDLLTAADVLEALLARSEQQLVKQTTVSAALADPASPVAQFVEAQPVKGIVCTVASEGTPGVGGAQ